MDGLAEWHRKADGNCAIDYGFHQIIGGVDDESLKAMTYLTDNEGITSFKLFMAYPGVFYSDDGQILRAMQTAAECGAMIMMHAENGIAIDVLVHRRSPAARPTPKYHCSPGRAARGRGDAPGDRARQGGRQRAAVHRAHVGSAALDEVAAARHAGPNVFAETCPQYLYLTLEEPLGSRASRAQVGVLARRCARSTSTTTPTSGRACG